VNDQGRRLECGPAATEITPVHDIAAELLDGKRNLRPAQQQREPGICSTRSQSALSTITVRRSTVRRDRTGILSGRRATRKLPPMGFRADDFEAGLLYRVMKEDARTRRAATIAGHLGKADPEIQQRQVQHFAKADPEYGKRVASALRISQTTEL